MLLDLAFTLLVEDHSGWVDLSKLREDLERALVTSVPDRAQWGDTAAPRPMTGMMAATAGPPVGPPKEL